MMVSQTKQVVCMKWGTLYGANYVNTLYSMVRRNLTGPLRFVCLTDDADGLVDEIEVHECPHVDIPDPYRLLGWRKLSLFGDIGSRYGMHGTWLFLDLDVVVVASLDELFTHEPELDFIVMRNWTQMRKRIGNTSVFRFRSGAHRYLLRMLEQEQGRILQAYNNSQTFVSMNIEHLAFWPPEWCVLFKKQCVPSWPLRLFKTPVLPRGAKLVAFPGVPNPHQAVCGEWPAKGYKKLYKRIRPTPWIAEHWR